MRGNKIFFIYCSKFMNAWGMGNISKDARIVEGEESNNVLVNGRAMSFVYVAVSKKWEVKCK